MNKNVLNLKLIIPFLLALSVIFFMSCEKEKNITALENQTIEEYNKNILDAYKVEFDQLNCLKSTNLSPKETLKTDEGKALFIEFCSNLKIEIKGIEYTINDYDPSLIDELYESTIDKLSHFDDFSLKSIKTTPTNEEIRDALKEECGKYMFGIETLCKLAVDIAYILR